MVMVLKGVDRSVGAVRGLGAWASDCGRRPSLEALPNCGGAYVESTVVGIGAEAEHTADPSGAEIEPAADRSGAGVEPTAD